MSRCWLMVARESREFMASIPFVSNPSTSRPPGPNQPPCYCLNRKDAHVPSLCRTPRTRSPRNPAACARKRKLPGAHRPPPHSLAAARPKPQFTKRTQYRSESEETKPVSLPRNKPISNLGPAPFFGFRVEPLRSGGLGLLSARDRRAGFARRSFWFWFPCWCSTACIRHPDCLAPRGARPPREVVHPIRLPFGLAGAFRRFGRGGLGRLQIAHRLGAAAHAHALVLESHREASDQGIYWTQLDGNNWASQSSVGGVGTSAGPALAEFDGLLYMVWKGAGNDSGIYWSQFNGSSWAAQQQVPGVGTSTDPAIASYGGALYMVWKGVGNDQGVYWTTNGVTGWQPQQVVSGIGSSAGPTVTAAGNGLLYMAWKGANTDSGIYWSNYNGTTWA